MNIWRYHQLSGWQEAKFATISSVLLGTVGVAVTVGVSVTVAVAEFVGVAVEVASPAIPGWQLGPCVSSNQTDTPDGASAVAETTWSLR